jgi:hypothetical protein
MGLMGATTSPRPADTLAELLAVHGLTGVPEEPMPHDGWSGAQMTRLTRADGARFVLKRDSLARDWIARVTGDAAELREALLVRAAPVMPAPVTLPHLGVARDGDEVVLLMPDLADVLIRWEQPIDVPTLERVLAALAALHRDPWHAQLPRSFPWTDRSRRLLLLTRTAAAAYDAQGLPFATRFLDGWDAFDRLVPRRARELIHRLTRDSSPLFAALDRLPASGLHGDLKLGNIGLAADGSVPMIDWQMTLVAPAAVELGWLLVANVSGLPLPPEEVLERYRVAADAPADARWQAERDLAVIVGLFLRGWRKGLDADASAAHPSGLSAGEDLAWWASNAVAAAQRQL